MLYAPQKGIWRYQTNMASVGADPPGTSVTSGAADTKGTAVELIASSSFDTFLVQLLFHDVAASATARRATFDLLIGAATESLLIENILAGAAPEIAASAYRQYTFPLYIPAGSRLAVAHANSTASVAARVGIVLIGGHISPNFPVAGRVDTYGVSGVTNGTSITVGGSGAEGSWTQVAASSNRDHFGFVPGIQTNDTSMTAAALSVDVGIGSATEEQIGEPFNYGQDATERFWDAFNTGFILHPVPASTRLVMRASSSAAADTTQCALYGLS